MGQCRRAEVPLRVIDERAHVLDEGTRPSPLATGAYFTLLTGLCAVVFLPSIRTRFFEDDFGYLVVTMRDGWWYSSPAWDFAAQVLRPITVIAIGGQRELFGFHPQAFHILAVGLTVSQGVLLYALARRLGLGVAGSRGAAAFLVLHTTMGWTLMWTASTSSLYAVNFALAVALMLVGEEITRRERVAATVLFALGLLSREITIAMPFILLFLRASVVVPGDWRTRLRRSLRDLRSIWIVFAVFLVARLAASGYAKTKPEVPRLVPILDWTSFSDALPDVPRHAHDLFILASGPFRSIIHPSGLVFPGWVIAVAIVFWAVVVTLVVFEVRQGRILALVGLGWFAIGLLPPIFLQPGITYGNYADLALPGLALCIGALFQTQFQKVRRPGRPLVAGACLGLLAFVAWNGGNCLIRPQPELITRATELEQQALRDYPDPERGATIVIRDAQPQDPLWSSNGDLFRILYDDPTLDVRFEGAGTIGPSP
jgi:hypothetical protein